MEFDHLSECLWVCVHEFVAVCRYVRTQADDSIFPVVVSVHPHEELSKWPPLTLAADRGIKEDSQVDQVIWGYYGRQTDRQRPSRDRPSSSAHISERSNKLFSGENKLGSPSKRLFKKPFLYASSKEARLVNRHGEFTAQILQEVQTAGAAPQQRRGEKEWRGVIHHTLNKSKCDWLSMTKETKQNKKTSP